MVTLTPLSLLQLSPARDTLGTVSDVASIVIAAAVLVLVILTAVLFLRISRILREIQLGVRQNLGPVSEKARSISANVEFITQSLRSDVEQLSGSVTAMTERLHLASDRMEERIEDFNVLMEVVQGEAEEIFLDTASTMRGVREGVRAISSLGAQSDEGEEEEEDDGEPFEEENAVGAEDG